MRVSIEMDEAMRPRQGVESHHKQRNMQPTRAMAGNEMASRHWDAVNELPADFYRHRAIRLEWEIRTMLHLDEKNHYQQQETNNRPDRSLVVDTLKLTGRWLLEFLGRFTRIDLLARDSFANDSNKINFPGTLKLLSDRLDLHRLARSEWHRNQSSFGWLWPRIIYLVWLMSALHLCVCLVFQYQHDGYKFRLRRVNWFNETHPEQFYVQRLETADYLKERLAKIAHRLERLGSGPLEASFLSQCSILSFVIVSTICYAVGSLYYKYKRPYCSDMISNQMDYSRETANCRRVIKEQASLFQESSRSFTRALVEFSEKSIGRRLFLERQTAWTAGTGDAKRGSISLSNKLSHDELAQIHLFNQQQQQQRQNHQPKPTGGLAAGLENRKRHSIQPGELNAIKQRQLRRSIGGSNNNNNNNGAPANQEDQEDAARVLALANSKSVSCRRLKLMVHNDHLMPICRSPKWVERLLVTFTVLLLASCPYIAIVDYKLIELMLELAHGPNGGGGQPAMATNRLLFVSELIVLLVVSNLSITFHGAIAMVSCVDQIALANRMLSLVKKLVHLNGLRFYGSLRPELRRVQEVATSGRRFSEFYNRSEHGFKSTSGMSNDAPRGLKVVAAAAKTGANSNYNLEEQQATLKNQSHSKTVSSASLSQTEELEMKLDYTQIEDRMNNDLLLVVMHYRLFFVRLEKLTRSFEVIALWAVGFLFLLPLIGRLHQPYFMGGSMRSLLLMFCCVIVVPVDIFLVPVCYLHRRCLDLYNGLNSVLAHATDIANHLEGRDVYDKHLISILRKELSHHDGIAAKFATKFAGISVTYPNLVRIHLYFGFLILSLLSDDQSSEQELTGSIFSDPFRLF